MRITSIKIADLRINLETETAPEISDNFKNFVTAEEKLPDCEASLRPINPLIPLKGSAVAESYDMDVIKTSEGSFYRYYHMSREKEYYAVGEPVVDGNRSVVRYSDRITLKNLNQCFHMTGWEKMMISHGRMILHSSCVNTPYGGILFSGISGIGKSTQADLWIKYRQASLINGDRTILYQKDTWRGYGSPFAGSSRCYVNESAPIKAIVMLDQSPHNHIRKLSLAEAFRAVYAGTTIYTWDYEFVDKSINLINELVSNIPVYLLSCTPDERAVRTLEEILKEE